MYLNVLYTLRTSWKRNECTLVEYCNIPAEEDEAGFPSDAGVGDDLGASMLAQLQTEVAHHQAICKQLFIKSEGCVILPLADSQAIQKIKDRAMNVSDRKH